MDAAPQTSKSVEDAGNPSSGDFPVAFVLTATVVAAAIGWSYRPSFQILIDRWRMDTNYGHGWFVIPIAIAILWQRRERLALVKTRPGWWAFLPLIALVLLRVPLYDRNEQWIENATIPAVAAAAAFALGGWSLIRWSWPAILFLFFLLPMPPSLDPKLAGQLQTIATIGSVNLLHAIGLPVINEGNVILVRDQRLEVAEACRGLSMMLSFATLITAMVILVQRPIWERVVLLISIVPIALACNIIRIAATALCYSWFGRPVTEIHDWAGLAMMPLALGIVLLEMKIMSWLIIDDEPTEVPSLIRVAYTDKPGIRN